MGMALTKITPYLSMMMALNCLSSQAIASDFNIPFINAAGLGTAYSDWATAASDASTAYSNPAGLTQITGQQLVFSALGLEGHTNFTGSSITPPYPFPAPVIQSGAATSHLGAFIPSFYYAAPINSRYVFGFSVNEPFALGTNYGTTSLVRYAATRSQVLAIDISPSLGIKLRDNLSVGLGVDAVRLAFTLNNVYGPPLSFPDSEAQNHLSGWGYGWHAGILYQMAPPTRIGFSFNSMVMIQTTGTSAVFASTPPTRMKINFNKTKAALPARAQLSAQHDVNPQWTLMATIYYTNWSTFDKLTMNNVMIPGGGTVSVTIPFNYHNTLDYSVGLNYKPTEKWIVRAGIQFMNTPSNNRNRGVADPIGSAVIPGIGAHYQQNLCLSYDVGVAHSFFKRQQVNLSNSLTALSGHNRAQSTVFGGQVNWNIT